MLFGIWTNSMSGKCGEACRRPRIKIDEMILFGSSVSIQAVCFGFRDESKSIRICASHGLANARLRAFLARRPRHVTNRSVFENLAAFIDRAAERKLHESCIHAQRLEAPRKTLRGSGPHHIPIKSLSIDRNTIGDGLWRE